MEWRQRMGGLPQVCSFGWHFTNASYLSLHFPLPGKAPSEANHTRVGFPVTKQLAGGGSWCAARGCSEANSVNFSLASPPTAAVGRYKLSLQVTCGNQVNTTFLGQFVLLFNPWCSGKRPAARRASLDVCNGNWQTDTAAGLSGNRALRWHFCPAAHAEALGLL